MVALSMHACGSVPIVIVPCLAALWATGAPPINKFLKFNVLSKTYQKYLVYNVPPTEYFEVLNWPIPLVWIHSTFTSIVLINFNNSGNSGHSVPQNYFPMVRLRCFLLNIYFCQNHWSFYTFTHHGRQNSQMNYTSLHCHVCFDFCKLKSYMV